MVQAVIFGITGFFTCFLLEYLSIYFTKKKCKVREIDFIHIKKFNQLKYILYAMNVALWIYSGINEKDFFLGIMISLLFSLAILISMIDLRIHIIPNELVLTIIIIGVVIQLRSFDLHDLFTAIVSMLGIGVFFLTIGWILGIKKIGAGDVKLAAAIGFILGYPDILTALLAMSLGFLIYCFIGFSRYKLSTKSMLPYAPFLMFGLVSSLVINTLA